MNALGPITLPRLFPLTGAPEISTLLSMSLQVSEKTAPSNLLDQFRGSLNTHPIATGIAVLMIAGSVIFWSVYDPSARIPDGDFIDEQTGEVSARSIDQLPPLVGSNGKATVVRAYYSVARDGLPRRLLYMQKYSDTTKAYLEQYLKEHRTGRPQFPDPPTAILVRAPEPGSPWVPLETPQGRKLAPDLWR